MIVEHSGWDTVGGTLVSSGQLPHTRGLGVGASAFGEVVSDVVSQAPRVSNTLSAVTYAARGDRASVRGTARLDTGR